MSSLPPKPTPISTSPGPLAPTDGSDAPLDHSSDEEAAPPPYPTTTESLVLKVNSSGPFARTMTVTFPSTDPKDSHKDSYTCALHSISKPHIIVTSSSGTDIGSVTFHPLSRKFTVVVHGSSTEIRHKGVFKSAYTFESPALGGKRLSWRGGATSVLVDDQEKAMARLEMTLYAPWKERTLEILRPWSEGAAKDEVLLSALAIMELRRRRTMYAAGAGGATG